MLGAGGIRPHSNAWDEYHKYLNKVHSILSFDFLTFFLIVFFFYITFCCLNCRNVVSFMMSLSFCNIVYIYMFHGRTVINVVRTRGPIHLYGY